MTLPFDADIIEECLGLHTFNKGLEYFRQRRVKMLFWHADTAYIEATVQGNRRRPYELFVEYYGDIEGGFVESRCSCPVGGDCKHVVAAMLAVLEQYQETDADGVANQDRDPLAGWQQALRASLPAPDRPEPDATGQPVFVYHLQPVDYGACSRVMLSVSLSHLLKRGGFGKCQPLSDTYRARFFQGATEGLPVDAAIGRLMAATDDPYGNVVLEGELGALLLKHLLASQRCFLHSDDLSGSALQSDSPRSLSLDWRSNEQGEKILAMTLDAGSENWVCVATSPPWYLDLETRSGGVVEHRLPGELLNRLQKVPRVPEDQAVAFSHFLTESLPESSLRDGLPLPVAVTVVEQVIPPQPVLTLHQTTTLWGRRRAARLQFRYGEQCFDWQPQVAQTRIMQPQGSEMRVFNRDPEQEQGFAARLNAESLLAAGAIERADPGVFLPPRTATGGLDAQELADVQFWLTFERHRCDALLAEGWVVTRDADFDIDWIEPDQWRVAVNDLGTNNDWFGLALDIDVEGETIPLLPILLQWLDVHSASALADGKPVLIRHGQRWLQLDAAMLAPVLETLIELFDRPQLDGDHQLTLSRPQLSRLAALGEADDWLLGGSERLCQLASTLRSFDGIAPCEHPAGVDAELRDYQHQGFEWLQFLARYGFGGVLADDMGLGKTLQTLTHLQAEKNQGRLSQPALVVAPTSVLHNWQREAERFTPSLRVAVLHGSGRHALLANIDDVDLLITSYALLIRDQEHFKQRVSWLVLDEAQTIKNPLAKSAQAARAIEAPQRLCLTGTPLENHLGELWSLFHFLMPGFLGDQSRFNRLFRHPIEKHGDTARQKELSARIAPFMLRRTKDAVATELPPKTEMVRSVELSGEQRKLYETIRISMEKRVQTLLQEKGLVRSHIEVLDALLKLRQVCCDPRLVKLPAAAGVTRSAKLGLLTDMLPSLIEDGRRILLFSQFTSMLDLIAKELQRLDIGFLKLTGRTRNRQALVDQFQAGDVPLFLISLKAGGTGLNLTAADTVIHYDPWWNPAVEQQATDRAYRIGQQQPVFVYRLVTEQTVEEKILALQARKQALASSLYGADKKAALPFDAEDLLALFQPI